MATVVSHWLSRRTFLKASAATAALGALGEKLFRGVVSPLVKGAAAPQAKQDEWIPTLCRQCRWHDGILVHVVDGVAVKIEGNPKDPRQKGRSCGKAQAGITNLYNPWRVKVPMKRTNPEKGMGVDPRWVEISWDEALDMVAQRIKTAIAEDPRQFAFVTTFGTTVRGVIGPAFGTPNETGWGPGEMCGGGLHFAPMRTLNSIVTMPDVPRCKYLLNFGVLFMAYGKATPSAVQAMTYAKERGMKLVVFDPLCSMDASKADEWIPILPATDQAVALAMANVLVNELGQYDVWSVKHRTNGPYLIGPDGWYVRSKTATYKDEIRKQTFGKPLIWDPVDGKAKTFDDPTIKDFALEGTYKVDGVECQPAFQKLKDFLKQYTPEWAERISTVPAATIRRIAKEFVEAAQIGSTIVIDGVKMPYRPAVAVYGKGSQGHFHATLICKSIELLNVLVGNIAVPGGAVPYRPMGERPVAGPDGTVLQTQYYARYRFNYPPQRIDQFDALPLAHTSGGHIAYSLLHPEKYGIQYRLKVLGLNFTNPLTNLYNYRIVEEAMKKIDFIFAISYHFDDATEMADVVLPEPSYLERWEVVPIVAISPQNIMELGDYGTGLRQPVVKRLYNTKDCMEILTEIAKRAGRLAQWNDALNKVLRLKEPYLLEPSKVYPWPEVLDRQLKSAWGEQRGLEWFRVNGLAGVPVKPAAKVFGYYDNPTTRSSVLYDEYTKWCGEQYRKDCKRVGFHRPEYVFEEYDTPLPTWKGRGPLDKAPPEYDLYAVNWAGPLHVMGMAMDDPWRSEYMGLFDRYTMYVWMNADTAAAKGLKDGDAVWVESQFGGRVKGEVKTSQCIHPQVVGIAGRFGSRSVNVAPSARQGMCFNDLLSSDEETRCPISGNVETSPRVKIYKA